MQPPFLAKAIYFMPIRADDATGSNALQTAFATVLAALPRVQPGGLEGTPARAAELWLKHLLRGEGRDLNAALGRGVPSTASAPVAVSGMGVHLICPHHLTVACGTADVAYVPAGRIVGLGRLSHLVEMATSRLVLQEDATESIATALEISLAPAAVMVIIEARHPCHTILHPRSHAAQTQTWALRGPPSSRKKLERLIQTPRRKSQRE